MIQDPELLMGERGMQLITSTLHAGDSLCLSYAEDTPCLSKVIIALLG